MLFRKKKEVKPEIFSEETCQSCGEKARRQFKEGDYIFSTEGTCAKCSKSTMMITAIYGEYPPDSKSE